MRIATVETLQADAGFRLFSFLKITTDDGIVGWSEYNESFGSAGLSQVIDKLSAYILGKDPLRFEHLTAELHVRTRQSRGGINHQAVAAIENALLDIKGKALGVPVYALFGGPVRERIPLYWSHTGTYRVMQCRADGRATAARRMTTSRGTARKSASSGSRRSRPISCPCRRQAWQLRAGLRLHAGLARAELGPPHRARGDGRAERAAPGRRARHGHHARHQLQLQN